MSPQPYNPGPSKLIRYSLALLLASGTARAQSVLPTGGHVVAGGATIGAPAGNNLAITQTTARAVVNWNGFSVGPPNAVTFNQPGSTAAILNRVTGSTPSTIAGQIEANGQVYLVNPNGIAITQTGNVQVGGGFVASTLGISNRDFMGGNLSFTGNGASAPVSNAGSIAAGPGGFVGLIGGTAANSGTIAVPLGRVGLGSGEAATLDLNGGGFLQVAAPTGATTAEGQALVTNSGQVSAAGGTVELRAATVATAIRDAVNMSGTVAATSATGRNGSITLSGGPGGAVTVTGTLDASAPPPTAIGAAPTGTGGTIKVTGNSVGLAPTARIRATGPAGGGTVEVGGGPHGADPTLANAQSVTVETGALIDASATVNGNGGTVSVWSDGTTVFNGTIFATGGSRGGNGGWVETSGHQLGVAAGASVDTLAPFGKTGTWLLDPATIEVETGGGGTLTDASATISTGDVMIDPSAIDGATSNVILNAATSVEFVNAVNMTHSGVSLTVQGGTVTLDPSASITTNNGDFIVQGFDNGSGPGASATSFTQNSGANISVGTGAININTSGAISLSATATETAGSVTLNAGTTITAPSGNVITAGTLTGSSVGDTQLTGANAISTLGDFSVSNGNFALVDTVPLTVSGTVTAPGTSVQLYLQAPSIEVAATGSLATDAGNGTTSLRTDSFTIDSGGTVAGDIVELAPNTVGNSLTLGATGAGLSLISTSGITTNNLNLGEVTAPGAGSPTTTAGPIAIGGAFDASGVSDVSLNATGAVTQTAPLSVGNLLIGTAGSYVLLDTGNSFPQIGVTATAGDIQIYDSATNVGLSGTSATGNIYIASPSLTLNGTIAATGASSTLGLQTDSLSNLGGTLSAATVEIAPLTSGNAVTLGTSTSGLSLDDVGFVSANLLRIGAVTVPGAGLTTTAGSIDFAGNFGSSSLSLELDSLGGVTESGGAITAGTLAGSADTAELTNTGNAIAELGSFTVTNGFDLVDSESLIVSGTVSAPAGMSVVTTGVGVTLTINGNLTSTGTVTSQVELGSDSTIIQDPASVINTPALLVLAGDTASLVGANTVDTLAAFISGSGSSFTFNNTAYDLAVDNVSGQPGITTNNGDVTLSTTTSGNITLNQPIDTTFSGAVTSAVTVTLNSVGTVGQTSLGVIIADSLAITAVGNVDLPADNLVNTLAANVTGLGATLDFSNARSLTVGTVGFSGVTTNGIDGSAANIVLRTTAGDLDIEEPVSTNGPSTVLGLSQGLIGLQAVAGNVVMNQPGGLNGGYLIAYGVEAIAGGNILLDGTSGPFGNHIGGSDDGDFTAQIAGTFAALATGPTPPSGTPQIVFNTTDAPLTVGTVGVSAGSLTLPTTKGVTSNGGEIDLSSTYLLSLVDIFGVTLNQPVSANQFDGGNNPTTVLQTNPGLVSLVAEAGGVTQSANGVILAGQLYAEADFGGVTLTAANRIGASDDINGVATIPGVVAGFANGDFKLVNHNAPLTIGQVQLSCGCVETGIQASGDIDLATTVAGAIEVDQPVVGNNVAIAVAPGNGFTNNSFIATSGPSGAVTILADQMTLSGGAILGGIVVLAPATPTNNIVLGGAGPAGTLTLQQADLDSIEGGPIQIGYRNVDGTPSLTSNITIAGDITIDTDFVPGLLLVTGGSVTEAGGGIIGAGSSGLQLGIMASGTNTLTAADNNIGRLAADIDGTDPSLTFTNAARLRVGTLDGSAAGISFDGDGFPSATPISNSSFSPLSGIITAGGASTTGGVTLTTTTGGITVFAPISAGAQPIELSAAGGITFDSSITTTGTLTATAGTNSVGAVAITQNGSGLLIVSGGASFTDESTGGAITLTDNNSLGGTVSLNTTGSGGTATLVNGIALTLGASTLGDDLTVSATDGLTVTGAVSSPGTIALNAIAGSGTGPLVFASGADVAAPTINLNGTSIALTGTAILGQTGATIDLASTSSTGGVTEDDTAQLIAGSLQATNGLTGAASLVGTGNAIQSLGAITVTGSGNGFALVTTIPLDVAGALTTDGGAVSLMTTGVGSNLSLDAPISAPGALVTLTSSGTVEQSGAAPITASGLTGGSAGGATLTATNAVGSLNGWTDTGFGFSFTDGQSLTTQGAISSTGPIALTTVGTGSNLSLDAAISTSSIVTLTSSGTVTQSIAAPITALAVTGGSAGGATLTATNAVEYFDGWTDTGSSSTGLSFTDGQSVMILGTVSSTGPIALTTTGTGSELSFAGNVSAPGNTVTLTSSDRINSTGAAVITANVLTGSSAGGTQLPGPNMVAVFGPFTDTAGGFITFNNAQSFAVAGTLSSASPGAGGGQIILSTSVAGANLTLGNGGGVADGTLSTTSFVQLSIDGTITQASGTITASALEGSSVGGASLTKANVIAGLFGPFTNTGSGDVSFTNAGGIVIAGVTNTVGNITLTTTSGDMGMYPATAVAASPTGTVTLVSGGGIFGSGSPGSYATISGGSLAVTAVGSVDLPGANTVNTLAANVTGAGASFDFSNAQTLTIGTVGGLNGVTTNGTDGSEANIVLQATVGDLYINQPISTNGANGTTLGLSLGEIGLQAAGKLIVNPGTSGNLIGFAVEAIAGDTLNLDTGGNRIGGNDVGGVAQTAGTFSGETAGAGASLAFGDADAPLTIDQVSTSDGVGVAAGSMSLPLISGVYSNGGTIALASEQSRGNGLFGLTLNRPVNANNFFSGSPSTVLQGTPGLVALFAESGDVTQTSTGVILGGQLFVESFTGSVVLTAANRLGANDSGGIAQTAGLLAGAAEGDFKFVNANAPLTIDTLSCGGCEGIFAGAGGIDLATTGAGALTVNKPVNSGLGINIAVAPGYGFTNNASDDPAFDGVYSLTGTPGTAGLDSSYAGAPITILADQMSLSGGTISTGGGPLILGPATPTTNVILAGGTVTPGTLTLEAEDFTGVQAGLVQIGYRNPDGTVSMTGNITIAGILPINTDNIGELMLMTGGSVSETASGAISERGSGALQLGIVAGGTSNLAGSNDVGTLAAYIDGANSSLSFANIGPLSVGTLSYVQAGVGLDSDGFPNPVPLAGPAANPLSGVTAAGGVTLSMESLTLAAPISAAGKTVTLLAGGAITQESGATITAATLTGSSNGDTTLTEANAVDSLGPFAASGGALTFNDTVKLTIGGNLSGASIVVATTGPDPDLVIAASLVAPTVSLSATGSITQNSDTTILATNLTAATQLDAGGAISLGSASNQVTGNVTLTSLNFAGTQLAGGAITFNDVTGFTIASLGGLQGGIGTTGAVSLTAGRTIGEASGATIVAGTLSGGSVGGATFSGANLIANLGSWTDIDSGSGSAGLTLGDNEALTVVAGSAVSSATGPVTLAVTGGNLTLGASSTVSGNGIVLATTGDFINNAGAGALTANPGSRWLVYSAAPAGDNFGNLDSGDTAIWNATYTSLPPASVTQGGNRYVFAQGQTLTATTISDSKTYGTDATTQVANDFAVTGYAPGVTNAYLGDTAATAYTGAPAVISTGSAATATVAGGPYAITVTAGTMAGADGYAVTFVIGGALTVTPATLTAGLTGAVAKVYDGTNVAALATGNYTLTGIVNGDAVTLNDPTTGTYATPNAGTGLGVTASGLTIGGSGVGNYTLASTTASANIGTITPALLTATMTGNPTKTYDGTTVAALVPGNFSLAGFVTGEGATVGPLDGTYATANVGAGIAMSAVLTSGDFSANLGTLLTNYTLPTGAAGTGTITPEPLTVAANNLTRQTGQPNPALTYTLTAGALFGGDALSGVLATTATQMSPVGPYAITEGTLAAPSANYALAFVNGVLTIVVVPNAAASPLMYVDTDWGAPGNTGIGGPNPGLTTCTPGNIAAQLNSTGQATLYGGGGCGGNL